jgi:hypothetical protein
MEPNLIGTPSIIELLLGETKKSPAP